MDNKVFTYKSNNLSTPIPSCILDLNYFKKLHTRLIEYNNDAKEQEISVLQKRGDQTEDEFNKSKDFIRNICGVTIEVFGSKGEYINTESPSIFDDLSLPDFINGIYFNNSFAYRAATQKEPQNNFKVNFDFRKPGIFDININASAATPNDSMVNIFGVNRIWVFGLYSEILRSLESHRTKRGWLHAHNVYDAILCFIFLPLIFFNLYKIESFLQLKNKPTSTFFIAAAYVYLFILLLLFLRIAFNYSKWVFPKIELKQACNQSEGVHRFIISTLALALISSFIYDITKFVVQILSK